MRFMRSILMFGVLVCALATPVHAQTSRTGMSIGFGAGVGRASIDCSTCGALRDGDPWRGGWGAGGYFSIGRWIDSRTRIDGDVDLWVRRSFAQQRDATLFSAAAVVHYYPIGALDVAAGAGPTATVLAGGPGYISSNGWALVFGAGYDIRTRTRMSWSPYARYVQLHTESSSGDNRGVRVLGPANPSSVQIGIGFRWN